MSIRSCLDNSFINDMNLNNKQLINATDLSPTTFGLILPPNPCGENSTSSQTNPGTIDEFKILKYVLSKYY